MANSSKKKDRLMLALLDAIHQNTRPLKHAPVAAAANQAVRHIRKDRIAGIEQAAAEIFGAGLLTNDQWQLVRRTAQEATEANS